MTGLDTSFPVIENIPKCSNPLCDIMDSPGDSVFTNTFMSFHKESCLLKALQLTVNLLPNLLSINGKSMTAFYFSDHRPGKRLFPNLKREHPNLSFTSELEKMVNVLFLDVGITRSNRKYSSCVYGKHAFLYGYITSNRSMFIFTIGQLTIIGQG